MVLMFGMNQKMMESLLKSQMGKLKKVKVEIERGSEKSICKITDQNIQQGSATIYLKDTNTGEDFTMRFCL